jgi:hypothetical protein
VLSKPNDLFGKGNVCFVRHGIYPSEFSVRREVHALLDAGYSVHMICLRGQGEAARELVDGAHVRRSPLYDQRGKFLIRNQRQGTR